MKPIHLACVALLALAASPTLASERRDEASVRAVESRWSEAFITGDAATLDALLDRDYVSVGPTGKSRPKDEIIAISKAYAAKHPGEHAQALPDGSTIQLIGAMALVKARSATDVSIDLFSFDNGKWRARYSQHTAVSPPAA